MVDATPWRAAAGVSGRRRLEPRYLMKIALRPTATQPLSEGEKPPNRLACWDAKNEQPGNLCTPAAVTGLRHGHYRQRYEVTRHARRVKRFGVPLVRVLISVRRAPAIPKRWAKLPATSAYIPRLKPVGSR